METPSTPRQSLRRRQFFLTAALVTPLIVAIATAPPFSAETRAQGTTHMLGPSFPIQAGGDNITPTRSGSSVTIPSRWACGSTTDNVLALSNNSGGRFLTASRDVGPRNQNVTFGTIVGGTPREFTVTETVGGVTQTSTRVTLIDQNLDGVTDGAQLTGTVSATVSFAYTPDSNYISIPWSQASALGIETSATCAGAVPQVWIPLADTNGDGRGDAIVLDLDGNGSPDADMLASPPVAAPAVPAMGPVVRLILMILIGLIGAWFLAHRRSDSTGTPAAV